MNTKKEGLARIFIYPSSKNKYTAVCLDFNIVEEADNFREAKDQILEAVTGYIENIIKNNLSEDLLNRNAPEKYWNLYREYNKFIASKEEKRKKAPRKVRESTLLSMPVEDLIENPGGVFV